MVNSVRDHYPDATYTGFCEKSPVYHRRTKFKKANVPAPVPVPGHGQSFGPHLAPQNSEPVQTRINQAPSQHSILSQFTMQFPQQSPDSQPPFFSQPIPTYSVSNQSNSIKLGPLKTITMSGAPLLTQQQQSNILLVGHVPHNEQQQTSGDETEDSSVGAQACRLLKPTNN